MLLGARTRLSIVAAGGGVAFTVTGMDCGPLGPPGPVQMSVKVCDPAGRGPTLNPVLEVGTTPLHPSAPLPPLAVQELAPVVLHARDVLCPDETTGGVAVNVVTVAGAGSTMTTAVSVPPPVGPWQDKVNE